jgi:CheY-like chemotaxis protein
MDWKMQGMDGIETTRVIQANTETAKVPTVIMVTAYGREELIQAVAQITIGSVLTKPVTASSLYDAIMAAMGHKQVAKASAEGRKEPTVNDLNKLRGARVLLVEDNEFNQELAYDVLTSNGLFIEIANDGQEAIDQLQYQVFDGVLMDCQMPVLDGYEATRLLRRSERFRTLPIIAMTANAMAGDRDKVIEAGMNDHIGKPIDVRKMFATMAKWIEPKSAISGLVSRGTTEDGNSVFTGTVDMVFPEIVGIDTKAGLQVTQGNQKLYRKLLIKFRDNYGDFARQFKQVAFENLSALILKARCDWLTL